ncbi:unnamed protein product [Calypogeia fissa]
MAAFGRIIFAAVVLSLLVVEIQAENSVEEILEENGLPKGLLPAMIKSYSISENGKFEVTLKSSCTTKIGSEDVYYKKTITGQLSYGQITNLAGIQAKEFFWVSITSIEVDKNDPNIIWFEVGFLSKSLSVDLFQVPPVCNSLSNEDKNAMTFSELLAKFLGSTSQVVPDDMNTEAARKMSQ